MYQYWFVSNVFYFVIRDLFGKELINPYAHRFCDHGWKQRIDHHSLKADDYRVEQRHFYGRKLSDHVLTTVNKHQQVASLLEHLTCSIYHQCLI